MSLPRHKKTFGRTNSRKRRQGGATSIEYALMASLIAIVVIVGVAAVGGANLANWSNVADKVVAAMQDALGR